LVLEPAARLDLPTGPFTTYGDAVSTVAIRPDLIDRMIELYCDWRTACAEVHAAYRHFCDAAGPDRAGGFAAYSAALDREEAACDSYAAHIHLIESRFSDATTLGVA
jgi:hypothetical protein